MGLRNHEGYYDPTAGKAMQRIWKRKTAPKFRRLTYTLGEVPNFRRVVREMILE